MFVVRILAYIIFSLFVWVKVDGKENFPEEGPVIVAGNHSSLLDPFMIGYRIKRKIHWMAKEELFRVKLFAKILLHLGAYPVKREKRDRLAISTTEELLNLGKVVGIFPQGTRRKTEGRDYDLKTGVAHFALESDANIQPVIIYGKASLFRRVHVKFGQPFKLEKKKEKYTKAELMDLTIEIMDKVYDLKEEKVEEDGNSSS